MLKRFSFFLLLFCFAGKIASAQAQTREQEANLKAVFIYNFTKYIEWENYNSSEFIIGILGSSAIDRPINEIARTSMVGNKKIIIKHFSKPEDISYCNIIFIPRNSPFSLQSILEKIDRGVLTISEEPGFAKEGTAFNFVVLNDKLKFQVNLNALYSAGLKAGSQLLKLAIVVD